MNKIKLIVVGGGGHGKVVSSLIKKNSAFKLLGYCDIEDKGVILDSDYLGNDDYILNEVSREVKLALGIGQLKNNRAQRMLIVNKFLSAGFSFPPIISSNAIVNDNVAVEDGTVIMDGVVINTGTKIGKFSIINTSSSVDHDCIIGDYVHIAPGCTLCGGVQVGEGAFLGAGTIVPEYREIPKATFIKAGTLYK